VVEGVEEEAKSKRLSVMDRIGLMACGESRPTCLRCDSVKPLRLINDPEGI